MANTAAYATPVAADITGENVAPVVVAPCAVNVELLVLIVVTAVFNAALYVIFAPVVIVGVTATAAPAPPRVPPGASRRWRYRRPCPRR